MFAFWSGDREKRSSCHHHWQRASEPHDAMIRIAEDRKCLKDRRKDNGASNSNSNSTSTPSSSSLNRNAESTSTTTTSTTSMTTMSSVTTEYVAASVYSESVVSSFITSTRRFSSVPFVMPMPHPNGEGSGINSHAQSTSRSPDTTVESSTSSSTSAATSITSGADPLVIPSPTSNSLPKGSGCLAKRDGSKVYPRQLCSSSPTSTSDSAPGSTLTVSESVLSSMSAVTSSSSTLLSATPGSTPLSAAPSASALPSTEPDHNGDGHHDGNGTGRNTNTVAIAGGVGAAGAIAIFSLIILFCLRRQRRRRGENDAAGAEEKGQGPERKWKKLGSRLRVNVQGLQGQAAMAGATLAAAIPTKFRPRNRDPYGQLRNNSAGSNYPTQGTVTPEPNFINGPQSSSIRFAPFAGWRQKLGESGSSPKPSPQPYPFLMNNPLGEAQVARNGSATSVNPFGDPPEPVYLRITNPDPGTPDSNGNTPRPKYLTAGPVVTPQGAAEPASYPFPTSNREDPFADPPANATIRDIDQLPQSLVPAALISRKPVAGAADTSKYLQPPQETRTRSQKLPSPPPPPEDPFEDPVPAVPEPPAIPDPTSSIPYTIPANATFDPSSTIYFVPSSHNSITPIATPPTPDAGLIHRSASKDTKARSDPFDLDRPEIWASLRTANARARVSETTDAATTERSAASVNWEDRERESRMVRDRWSRANPGRESPTIGIGI